MNNPVKWFQVNHNNMALEQIDINDWPEEMTKKNQMPEECLESVIAWNLGPLFPGEDLLLIKTQFPLMSTEDITAIDSNGTLRIFEIKKSKPKSDDIIHQALKYSLQQASSKSSSWQNNLLKTITFLPEEIEKSLTSLKYCKSLKRLGTDASVHLGVVSKKSEWENLNRFEQARRLCQKLDHREDVDLWGLNNPIVQEIIQKVYGLNLTEDDLNNPTHTANLIFAAWGRKGPSRSGIEVTLAAPGAKKLVDSKADASASLTHLDKCQVPYHIIDAELRCTRRSSHPLKGSCERAILRWEPIKRRLDTSKIIQIHRLRKSVEALNPDAAQFKWNLYGAISYFEQHIYMYLALDEKNKTITAKSEWLTEGLEHKKSIFKSGIQEIHKNLSPSGSKINNSQTNVTIEWNPENPEKAAQLVVEFYNLNKKINIREHIDWYLRP